MADRKLIVQVVGDSTSYVNSLNRANKATSVFNANLSKTTKASQALRGGLSTTKAGGGLGGLLFGSTAFVGAAITSKAIGTAISAASDMNEQLSKSNVVFGQSAQVISDWSKTTSTAFGISRVEAIKAAGTFGSLFSNTGQTQANAAAMSKVVVELAGDLASFNNTSTSDALDALRSGLSGEIEPLRRFQVFLTEAAVAQRAMAETGKTSATQLTQGEKITARYALVLEQTKRAQGDFARTSGSLANQQRVLTAQTADLAAKVGTVLLPGMTLLVTALNDAFQQAGLLAGALGQLAQIPAIEIPVKFVSEHGHGKSILEDVLLGVISPGLLAVKLGAQLNFQDSPALKRLFDVLDGIGGPGKPRSAGGGGHEQTRDAGAAVAAAASASAKGAATAIARATASANRSLTQQIKDVGTRIAHLKDLIREDPTNVKLQQRLTAELKTQNSLLGDQKSLNASNAAAAKSAAQAAHTAAVQAAADQLAAKKAAAERLRDTIKRNQFQALGLTAEGLKPTPGSESLLKRARSLEDQIKGTPLDAGKAGAQLRKIVGFLKKHFKTAGKDVREAILSMLNDISSALDSGKSGSSSGPLTKTTSLNSKKVLAGLGLSPEEIRNLRSRLSNFNSAGIGLSGSNSRTTGSGFSAPIVVESHIYLDGRELETSVTRRQQKTKKRNPKQKRGPNRGD